MTKQTTAIIVMATILIMIMSYTHLKTLQMGIESGVWKGKMMAYEDLLEAGVQPVPMMMKGMK